jgi:hypothetical protein
MSAFQPLVFDTTNYHGVGYRSKNQEMFSLCRPTRNNTQAYLCFKIPNVHKLHIMEI